MLLEMLTYKRPEGSLEQQLFCERFLLPIMGPPDRYGNYIKEVGHEPTIAFMAHHDTVHSKGGFQVISFDGELGHVYSEGGDCLGADCTTGVWLILEMIRKGVSGVYVVHAAEEVGCIGSRGLVDDNPPWLTRIQAAISLDRYGTGSVITHQMGMRTASDVFAQSFSDATGMPLTTDKGGVYTDSNEYADIVPECTNISVGYYKQHTAREYQDLDFAYILRDALIEADWSKLVIARDPKEDFQFSYPHQEGHWKWAFEDNTDNDWDYPYSRRYSSFSEQREIADILREYPSDCAALLLEMGVTLEYLAQELDLRDY